MSIIIEPLGLQHNRAGFSCGAKLVDQFCKTAHPEHFASKRRIYVCCADDKTTVIGFYSLSLTFLRKSRNQKINEPSIHLEMIGVAEASQGQGLGSALLAHAFQSVSTVADLVGVMWIFLEAINEKSETFYTDIGFKWFNQDRKEMIIPIDAIKMLVEAGDAPAP